MPVWVPHKTAEGLPTVSKLRKSTDVIGDGAAPEEANRRSRNVIVSAVGRSRRRLISLGVGEPDDGHHRDRWHPSLLVVLAGIVLGWEQRRAVLPTARRVAPNFKAPAVRSKSSEIGVTGAARLAGLPSKAGKGLRRWRNNDRKKSSQAERQSCR